MYNVFKYKKYEKIKTENGWTVKSVLRKKNSYGEIAFIEELNSDKLPCKETSYSDENFKNVIRTSKLEFNEDKSYTLYDVYEHHLFDYQSIIGTFDNKKRQLSSKMYSDKNFEKLIGEGTYKYNKNGSYELRVNYDENNWCVIYYYIIYYYKKNGVKYKCEVYDKDFKNLLWTADIKELKNGGEKIYTKTCMILRTCNNDGSVEEKIFHNSPITDPDGIKLNIVRIYDKERNSGEEKCYKDKKGRKLYKIRAWEHPKENIRKETTTIITGNKKEVSHLTEEFLENGNTLCSESYDTLQFNEYLSKQWEAQNHLPGAELSYMDKTIWEKYFYDKDFKELNYSVTYEYPDENTKVCKATYEKARFGNRFSQIMKLENNKIKYQYYYSDKNFRNLTEEWEYIYNEDGSYTEKLKRVEPDENNCKSCIIIYDNNDKIIEKNYYFDDNFENLYYKSKYERTKNPNKYSIKQICTEPYKNYMSCITTYCGESFRAEAYKDNNFKELYRKSWGKKPNKKQERIVLRIYNKSENGYPAVIEKLDKDNNTIFEKKYKSKFTAWLCYIFFK